MKRVSFLLSVFTFAALFSGCSGLAIPSSVAVKMDNSLSVSMGTKLKSVYDYIDPYATISDLFKNDSNTSIHDYQPDSTPVQMYALETQLMKYELPNVGDAAEIPVAIADIKSKFNAENTVDLKDFTLNSLLENMPSELTGKENINLANLDVYIYAIAPSELGTLSGVEAKVTYDGNSSGESVLVSQDSYNFVSASPNFPAGKAVYTQNLSQVAYTAKLDGDKLTQLMNSRKTNMKLTVKATLESSITQIQKAAFPDNDYSVYIKAVIVMPLQFTFSGEVTYKAYSAEEDLFQRTNGKFEDDTKEIVELVDSISLKIGVKNTSGFSPCIRFKDASRTISGKAYSGTGILKEYSLGDSSIGINFDSTEIKKITDSTNFCPEFYIYVPDSNGQVKSVLRNASVEASFSACVKLAGKIEIF